MADRWIRPQDWPTSDDGDDWRADALAAREALPPLAVAVLLPRLTHPELLAYDEAPAPLTTGQRLLAAALAGPWLACSAGWAAVVGVAELARWIRR